MKIKIVALMKKMILIGILYLLVVPKCRHLPTLADLGVTEVGTKSRPQ